MAATMQEIAKLAGVSAATVSAVRNGTEGIRVSAATNDRVTRIMESKGVTPRRRRSRSKVRQIVLFIAGKNSHFKEDMLYGISECLAQEKIRVVLSPYHISAAENEDMTKNREQFTAEYFSGSDGAIFIGDISREALAVARQYGIPFVICGSHCPDPHTTHIYGHRHEMVYLPFDVLYQLGHRRIAIINHTPATTEMGQICTMAYSAVHSKYDLVLREEYLCFDACTEDNWHNFVSLLSLPEPPTAVIGAEHVKCAEMKGFRVPEDISVVSINASDADTSNISYNVLLIGYSSAEELLARIADPDRPHRHIVIPPMYKDNGTCAPPRTS